MLILLLLNHLFSFQTAFHGRELPQNDTLLWATNAKLTWDDFHAKPPTNSSFAAFTYTIVNMEYSVVIEGESLKPKFNISAAFNRRKSWVQKKPEAQTMHILKHEQGHFDIAELTARKLRKRLKSDTYNRRNYREQINSTYQTCIEEGEKLQALYDEETQHGLEKKRQAEWLKRIALELNDHAQWAN